MEPFIFTGTLLSLGLIALLAPRFGTDSRGDAPTWPGARMVDCTRREGCR